MFLRVLDGRAYLVLGLGDHSLDGFLFPVGDLVDPIQTDLRGLDDLEFGGVLGLGETEAYKNHGNCDDDVCGLYSHG